MGCHKIGRCSYSQNLKIVDHPGVNLTIGAFCSIGPKVTIFLGMNHRTDWITTFPFGEVHTDKFGHVKNTGHPSSKGDVVIGNDVWIGSGACIMSGVTIGDGAVVAANSHVVNDVKAYEIVGGNPAKHIKFRFSSEIIDALLEFKWWEKTDREIRELVPMLMSKPDIRDLK